MKTLFSFLFILLLFFNSCNSNKKVSEKTIALITLAEKEHEFLPDLKKNIEQFYGCKVIILPHKNAPTSAYNMDSRHYYADSLLTFLSHNISTEYDCIQGILDADIAINHGQHRHWKVFGLGYCPGNSSVISPYRMYGNNAPMEQVKQRLLNVSIHEIGHNLGLQHCSDTSCLMKDAKSSLKNIDGANKKLCSKCKKIISNE